MAENGSPTRKVLLVGGAGVQRLVEFPAEWKMTFGRVQPGAPGNGYEKGTLCLRLYEGTEKNLRACFNNVLEFYDVTNVTYKQMDKNGVYQAYTPDEGEDKTTRLDSVKQLMGEYEEEEPSHVVNKFIIPNHPSRKKTRTRAGKISNVTEDAPF